MDYYNHQFPKQNKIDDANRKSPRKKAKVHFV